MGVLTVVCMSTSVHVYKCVVVVAVVVGSCCGVGSSLIALFFFILCLRTHVGTTSVCSVSLALFIFFCLLVMRFYSFLPLSFMFGSG